MSSRLEDTLTLKQLIIALPALCLAFSYGVGVGVYHWPPFSTLNNVKDTLSKLIDFPREYRGEDELLRFAFTDPMIPGEQVRAPITSLDGILQANTTLKLSVEDFFDAYDRLDVLHASELVFDQENTDVLRVTYEIVGEEYEAYAYSRESSEPALLAALIIPGSGFNQSSAIYNNDESNYHFGMMDAFSDSVDRYVFIKPNEDLLAFHDGSAKLNKNFIINWLLNNGASYSSSYLAGSLAITKYLKGRYNEVVVAGLSQGGDAALLNAMQSQPSAVISASGFSVIDETVSWSDHNMIVIPGLRQRLSFDVIRSQLQKSPTRFLFTYGRQEQGNYRIEAEERVTCEYLPASPNIECKIHDGGHVPWRPPKLPHLWPLENPPSVR